MLPARLDRVLLEVCIFEAGLAKCAEQQIRCRPGLGTARHAATDRVGQPLKEGKAPPRVMAIPTMRSMRSSTSFGRLRQRGTSGEAERDRQPDADPMNIHVTHLLRESVSACFRMLWQ